MGKGGLRCWPALGDATCGPPNQPPTHWNMITNRLATSTHRSPPPPRRSNVQPQVLNDAIDAAMMEFGEFEFLQFPPAVSELAWEALELVSELGVDAVPWSCRRYFALCMRLFSAASFTSLRRPGLHSL